MWEVGISAPVRTPDFETCQVVDYSFLPQPPPPGLNCCPVLPTRPEVPFKFPNIPASSATRVRPAIQCADKEYVAKLAKAYELMRALPDSDPRSMTQQSNLHCAYCGGAFIAPGSNNTGIDIHFSWFFFPWHRAYIYFHERILQSLLNDTTFSLPFWNWDGQLDSSFAAGDNSNCFLPGNKVPDAYIDNPSLAVPRAYGYDFASNSLTQPTDAILDIASPAITNWTEILQKPKSFSVASNLYVMYQAVVAPNDAQTFYGAPSRVSSARALPRFNDAYKGAIEMGPHVAAHFWARALVEPYNQSYGNWNAAQDPLFFANHGNIDRLWTVWKSLGGPRRKDLTDPDWLNVEFKFYDENSDLVTIKIKDVLSTEKLGYRYQPVADAWSNYNHAPICSTVLPSELAAIIAATPVGVPAGGIPGLPQTGFMTVIRRPARAVGVDHDLVGMEETLTVSGIKLSQNVPADFAVFVNAPDALATESRWSCAEFVGRFAYTPIVGGPTRDISDRSFSLRASIGKKLELLGINHQSKLLISVYPVLTSLNLGPPGTPPSVAVISLRNIRIQVS